MWNHNKGFFLVLCSIVVSRKWVLSFSVFLTEQISRLRFQSEYSSIFELHELLAYRLFIKSVILSYRTI